MVITNTKENFRIINIVINTYFITKDISSLNIDINFYLLSKIKILSRRRLMLRNIEDLEKIEYTCKFNNYTNISSIQGASLVNFKCEHNFTYKELDSISNGYEFSSISLNDNKTKIISSTSNNEKENIYAFYLINWKDLNSTDINIINSEEYIKRDLNSLIILNVGEIITKCNSNQINFNATFTSQNKLTEKEKRNIEIYNIENKKISQCIVYFTNYYISCKINFELDKENYTLLEQLTGEDLYLSNLTDKKIECLKENMNKSENSINYKEYIIKKSKLSNGGIIAIIIVSIIILLVIIMIVLIMKRKKLKEIDLIKDKSSMSTVYKK